MTLYAASKVVISAESARWLADFGWNKHDVKRFIYDNARRPVRELRDRGGWGKSPLPSFVDVNDDDAMVPIVKEPENIVVLVAGGHQRHMNALLTAGYSMSVTKPVTLEGGTPIKSTRDSLK